MPVFRSKGPVDIESARDQSAEKRFPRGPLDMSFIGSVNPPPALVVVKHHYQIPEGIEDIAPTKIDATSDTKDESDFYNKLISSY